MKKYIDNYLTETVAIANSVDRLQIERAITLIKDLRNRKGRLFILGIGGSAANASHAVNDFRKIAGIETYAPTDNVSELTARTNDDGWDTTFYTWLETSRLGNNDALLILSVGGGSQTTSQNLVKAVELAKQVGATIISIVSRDGGITKQRSDACILIPVVSDDRITPHAEGWQGVIWHLIVNAVVQ